MMSALAALMIAQAAAPTEPAHAGIPQALLPAVESASFRKVYEVGVWLNPFYLRGDFDGDGSTDYALLVRRRSDGKKGIAIWFGARLNSPPRMIGAGTNAPVSGGLSGDWDFFDAWQVYGKRKIEGRQSAQPAGEAILIERRESASGLLYWDGKRFRWRQLGD